jgi:hypothetical protein
MWLNRFKIALVQKDAGEIARLIDVMPRFDDVAEMEEAACLCREAEQLLQAMKAETLRAKTQLQKNIEFLRSAHADAPSELDLKS